MAKLQKVQKPQRRREKTDSPSRTQAGERSCNIKMDKPGTTLHSQKLCNSSLATLLVSGRNCKAIQDIRAASLFAGKGKPCAPPTGGLRWLLRGVW